MIVGVWELEEVSLVETGMVSFVRLVDNHSVIVLFEIGQFIYFLTEYVPKNDSFEIGTSTTISR